MVTSATDTSIYCICSLYQWQKNKEISVNYISTKIYVYVVPGLIRDSIAEKRALVSEIDYTSVQM